METINSIEGGTATNGIDILIECLFPARSLRLVGAALIALVPFQQEQVGVAAIPFIGLWLVDDVAVSVMLECEAHDLLKPRVCLAA